MFNIAPHHMVTLHITPYSTYTIPLQQHIPYCTTSHTIPHTTFHITPPSHSNTPHHYILHTTATFHNAPPHWFLYFTSRITSHLNRSTAHHISLLLYHIWALFKSSLKAFFKTFSSVSLPWYATGVCLCVHVVCVESWQCVFCKERVSA